MAYTAFTKFSLFPEAANTFVSTIFYKFSFISHFTPAKNRFHTAYVDLSFVLRMLIRVRAGSTYSEHIHTRWLAVVASTKIDRQSVIIIFKSYVHLHRLLSVQKTSLDCFSPTFSLKAQLIMYSGQRKKIIPSVRKQHPLLYPSAELCAPSKNRHSLSIGHWPLRSGFSQGFAAC